MVLRLNDMALKGVSACFLCDVRFGLHGGQCDKVVGDVALLACGERLCQIPFWIIPACQKRQQQYSELVIIAVMCVTQLQKTGSVQPQKGLNSLYVNKMKRIAGREKNVLLCVKEEDAQHRLNCKRP